MEKTLVINAQHSLRRCAFTLVELLVCIAILAVLMSILLPALGKARKQARMVSEFAGGRQMMLGYLSYAQDFKERLIPGHLTNVEPLKDDRGKSLSPIEVVKRWPWRLRAYMGTNLDGVILVGERAKALANRSIVLWSYQVSLTPSFGLNLANFGGEQDKDGKASTPDCIIKSTQVTAPSRMVVFASARSIGDAGIQEGYWRVAASSVPSEYSANGWSLNGYAESGEPGAWGFVHGRWNGRTVGLHLDGHGEGIRVDELRDMTLWSEAALQANDKAWKP